MACLAAFGKTYLFSASDDNSLAVTKVGSWQVTSFIQFLASSIIISLLHLWIKSFYQSFNGIQYTLPCTLQSYVMYFLQVEKTLYKHQAGITALAVHPSGTSSHLLHFNNVDLGYRCRLKTQHSQHLPPPTALGGVGPGLG